MNYRLLIMLCVSCLCLWACSFPGGNKQEVRSGLWTILYNTDNGTTEYRYNGKTLLKDVYVKARYGKEQIESKNYNAPAIERQSVTDFFGRSEEIIFTYTHPDGKPTIRQVYSFYPGTDYFLTEVFLESDEEIQSNYIAPIYTKARNSFLAADKNNRALRVPFDNDNFVHYLSSPLTGEDISFEVTAIFNGPGRQGIVVGSVEHDTWKTGIRYRGEADQYITELECFGGVTHEETRDISDCPDRPSKEHGSIKGKSLKSPKLFFGMFTDWRRGMEQFGEVNARIAPPRTWTKGTPFGWNSWAALAEKVNYEGAIDVADFVKNELQSRHFENDGTVYIGLDSFWDNFTEEQLKQFVDHCHANGQQAGIYWCPFSDWHANSEADIEGTNGQWKYKEAYLYANGKPRKIESLAMDPTHPATKKRMDHYIGKFKRLGYTYVKLDFINNGILEADSFYNPDVTTGVQAYNEGMQYLTAICGKDMFLALSIAPTFPAQYGNSKRISCDAWGAMTEGEWGTTGYMLNSLSFGWWLDRVYPFNDADHILLWKPQEAKDYQEGANRARITSAVITGLYMLGDNFSSKGLLPGDKEARERVLAVATNPEINDIARIGKSFYPVEGYTAAEPGKAETMYVMHTGDKVYVAIFNFDPATSKEGSLDLSRVELSGMNNRIARELWTSTDISVTENSLFYSIPPQDVRVYCIPLTI